MVQVINTGNPQGKLAETLGMSLGQGLGQGLNTFYANKAIDEVLNDPNLKDAPLSQKWQQLGSTLSKYGETGQQLLQQRLQAEQYGEQEKQQKIQQKKGDILRRRLAGESISDAENKLFTADEELAIAKHQQQLQIAQTNAAAKGQGKLTQASQPINPEQLAAINKVESDPKFKDATLPEKGKMLRDAQVSKENADAVLKPYQQQSELDQKATDTSFNLQKDFIAETTNAYKGFETEMKPRLMQMQKIATDEDLIGAPAAKFLEVLDIPLGILENPSNELYSKLSQDLLKGLPETYGSRILKVEVENFLKTIPTLMNSPEGRRMIASNMLKLGEMKEVYYNEMRRQQLAIDESGKPYPRDFQQRVFDQVKPQIDRINNEFVKMSEIKSVPEGTIPYFSPSGEIEFVPKEHAQWASENGGTRIW